VLIREANESDYAAMNQLFAEVDAQHADALPEVFCNPQAPGRPTAFLDSTRAASDAAIFVAEEQDRVVGLAVIRLRAPRILPILRRAAVAHLEDLVVAADSRRRGVGTALLRKAEAWARAHNAERLELDVWEFNHEAIRFYEAQGYRTGYRRMARTLARM
jgi:GNAT superfamily N-acetyltransferase